MTRRPPYFLALDQGTTSSRAVVFDGAARLVAIARKEFPQHYPRPGWVEHDPRDIWSSQSGVIAEALAGAGLRPADIEAVGLTNQRETTVVWERSTGRPVSPAIVWQDRRTAPMCRALSEAGHGDMITRRTGLRLDPYFSATKLRWILDHVDGAADQARRGDLLFGTVDSWLLWRLTGGAVHATDLTNASRTLLCDIHTGQWDADLLDVFGIPGAMLPEIHGCAEVFGTVAAGEYLAGKRITGIAGDQHAALFGQACVRPGMAKNTYGTGCFFLMNTGDSPVVSRNNLLTTVAWRIAGSTEFALEGSVFIGGALIQWIRDELGLVRSAGELDELAASVPDANGLFLVPAFTGLGAPHWDPSARGLAIGITRGVNRAHFCRAALEGIAFQVADLIRCIEADSGLPLHSLRVDGGASASRPLLQIQADLLQRNVIVPECRETTALGAALLAGIGCGHWGTIDEAASHWRQDETFRPAAARSEAGESLARWNKAVGRAGDWQT